MSRMVRLIVSRLSGMHQRLAVVAVVLMINFGSVFVFHVFVLISSVFPYLLMFDWLKDLFV
jgi:hypothetical protein